MRCISPILIKSKKRRDFVPCGKCLFCLQNKRGDWSFRLNQELKTAKSAHFLTLTYDNDNLPRDIDSGLHTLAKRDLVLFTKRIRKENAKYVSDPVRYYSVGEYGTRTDRPHYHSIIFNLVPQVVNNLHKSWPDGFCHVGKVEEASIHYVTKYVINRIGKFQGREPPFALMSRRPGIGSDYVRTHAEWHQKGLRNYTQVKGEIKRLPRYYKDKIFTDSQKARIAEEAILLADSGYHEEIVRLSQFHSDPYYYYDERVQHAHEKVKEKINELNLF